MAGLLPGLFVAVDVCMHDYIAMSTRTLPPVCL